MLLGILALCCAQQKEYHLPAQTFKTEMTTRGPVTVPAGREGEVAVDRDLSFLGSLKVSPSEKSDLLSLRFKIAGQSNLKSLLIGSIPEMKPAKQGGIGREGEELLIDGRYRFGVNLWGLSKSLWAAESTEDPGMQWMLASALALADHQRTAPKEQKFVLTEVDGMKLEAEVRETSFNSVDPFLLKNFTNYEFSVSRRDNTGDYPKYVTGVFILQKKTLLLKEFAALYDLNNSPSAGEPRSILQKLLWSVRLKLEDESLAKR